MAATATTMYLDDDVKRDLQAWSDASEVPKVRTVNRGLRLHLAALLAAAPDDLPGVQTAVLHAIVHHRGYGDGWCFASPTRLGMYVQYSARAVEDAITALVACGWLECDVRPLQRVPGQAKRHVRLTPVPVDCVTAQDVDDAVAAAREATKGRVSAHRARVGTTVGGVTVTAPHVVHPPDVTAPHVAEYPETGRSSATDNAQGSTAADAYHAAVIAPPVEGFVVVGDVRIPQPWRVGSVVYESHIAAAMLALGLSHDAHTPYGLSLCGTEHNLGILEIGECIRKAVDKHGTATTPQQIANLLCHYGYITELRRNSMRVWWRKLGVFPPVPRPTGTPQPRLPVE